MFSGESSPISQAKMSSSVFMEGAVTTADKAVDGDTGVAAVVRLRDMEGS